MQKWEYMVIKVVEGKVEKVNDKPIVKGPPKGLLMKVDTYSLIEYLSKIGNEGWEVVTAEGVGLSNSAALSMAAIIAKRPVTEQS